MHAPESHPGVAAAARLRRLASRLQDGDDDGRWLAAGLLHYLEAAPSGIDLDRALGLATAPGGSPWWRVPTMAERDRLIRYLAADLGGRTNQRAAQLQQRLRRYASSAWLRDRVSKAPTAANSILYRIQGCSVLLKSVREDAFQGQGIVGGRAPLTSITPCAGGRHGAVR